MTSSSSAFSYIITSQACLEKEFPSINEAMKGTSEIFNDAKLCNNLTSLAPKTTYLAVISTRQLTDKEQAMLVLASL